MRTPLIALFVLALGCKATLPPGAAEIPPTKADAERPTGSAPLDKEPAVDPYNSGRNPTACGTAMKQYEMSHGGLKGCLQSTLDGTLDDAEVKACVAKQILALSQALDATDTACPATTACQDALDARFKVEGRWLACTLSPEVEQMEACLRPVRLQIVLTVAEAAAKCGAAGTVFLDP